MRCPRSREPADRRRGGRRARMERVPEDRELGAPVDWTPARRPPRAPVDGRHVRLQPFAEWHSDALPARLGAGGPGLWDYLPYGRFAGDEWRDWFAGAAASDDPLFHTVVD